MKRIHRAIRWFVLVLPPAWMVFIGLAVYGIVEGLHQYTLSLNAGPESLVLGRFSDGIVLALVNFYALYRGLAFHPAYRDEYLKWLGLTPWRYPTPLPLGPIQVVPQDLVVLALFELMLWDAPLHLRLTIPAVFLFGLAACWALSLWVTEFRSAFYQIGYALGTTLWISSLSPSAAFVCLIATYILALFRLQQSFATFPWSYPSAWRQLFTQKLKGERKAQGLAGESTIWGWSYDVLSPHRVEQWPLRDRLLLSGLAGWFALAIMSNSQFKLLLFMVPPVAVVGGAVYCFKQVLSYVWSHSPPISLGGRLLTGRWVIPSYDVALLPIVYYFGTVFLAFYLVGPKMEWPIQYVLPAALAVYLVLMNLACPDVNRWRLTCKARLNPWVYAAGKSEFEQL